MTITIQTFHGDTVVSGTIVTVDELKRVAQVLGHSIKTVPRLEDSEYIMVHFPPRTDGIEVILDIKVGSWIHIVIPSQVDYELIRAEAEDVQL